MICNGQGLKALSAPAAVWPSLLLLAGFTILLREDAATQNALREAVTSIPVEEVQDVKGLKQHLNRLHGLPRDLGRGFSSAARL